MFSIISYRSVLDLTRSCAVADAPDEVDSDGDMEDSSEDEGKFCVFYRMEIEVSLDRLADWQRRLRTRLRGDPLQTTPTMKKKLLSCATSTS